MTLPDLAKLVQDMREAQKAYFTARKGGGYAAEELKRSKQLEREVDAAVAAIMSPPPQTTLPI